MNAVQYNLDLSHNYKCHEDWLYDNVLYEFFKNNGLKFDDITEYDVRTKTDNELQRHWLEKFHRDDGETKIYEHTLNDNSVVFDMGSYKGEFANELQRKYNCNIHCFEPVPSFCLDYIPSSPKIKKYNYTLGEENGVLIIYLNSNASGEYADGVPVDCNMIKFENFIHDNNITKIDLLKLNIEGSEFDLLEHLLWSSSLDIIDSILVQFHYINKQPHDRREKIIQEIKQRGFKTTWSYPFVWELFSRV